jgi:predicted transcriptional regulator
MSAPKTVGEYRPKLGLSADYPMAALSYSETRGVIPKPSALDLVAEAALWGATRRREATAFR